MEDTILVSYVQHTNGDIPVLIVGRKRPNESLDIINAFKGDEASELHMKLIKLPAMNLTLILRLKSLKAWENIL